MKLILLCGRVNIVRDGKIIRNDKTKSDFLYKYSLIKISVTTSWILHIILFCIIKCVLIITLKINLIIILFLIKNICIRKYWIL